MFYRIRNDKIYDYADYEYSNDCLFTDLCTMKTYEENKDIYEIVDGQISLLPNLEEVLAQTRKKQFEDAFFLTSLGWIRRKVTMKDGSVRDFLADLLMPIKAGMELGQDVEIITYKTPDYTNELSSEYIINLQEQKIATPQFIRECLFQTVRDFNDGESGGNNGV